MPIIDTSCGAQSGTMNTWLSRVPTASPTPTPYTATSNGRPGGDDRSEGDDEDHQRGDHADLLRPGLLALRVLDDRAARLDLQTVDVGAVGERDHRLADVERQLLAGEVELDGRQHDGAVRRHVGWEHGHHVRQFGRRAVHGGDLLADALRRRRRPARRTPAVRCRLRQPAGAPAGTPGRRRSRCRGSSSPRGARRPTSRQRSRSRRAARSRRRSPTVGGAPSCGRSGRGRVARTGRVARSAVGEGCWYTGGSWLGPRRMAASSAASAPAA